MIPTEHIGSIITAYEVCGLNEWAIAEQFDLEHPGSVLSVLSEHSTLYQERQRQLMASGNEDGSLSVDQLKRHLEAIATGGDSSMARERALRFLINEKKGRNDVDLEHLKLKKSVVESTTSQQQRLEKFNELVKKNFGKGNADAVETVPAMPEATTEPKVANS